MTSQGRYTIGSSVPPLQRRIIPHVGGSEFATNELDDQELLMLSLHLLQVSLVYVNTLMMRNLLQFARQEPQAHSPARLADIVEQTLSLFRAVLRRDQITLTVDVPEDLPSLTCRSQQIQQVIMNLLTNARDALNAKYPGYHEDKTIRITAREVGGSPQCGMRNAH
jgi:signal transduction histidine kinase